MAQIRCMEMDGTQVTRKDQCPIYGDMEDVMHIVLRWVKTSNWSVEAICEKWRSFNGETVLKKCVTVAVEYVYQVRVLNCSVPGALREPTFYL
jgi:hypothetical protein